MAGPSVGHIEVTVDANTGKLKAQIVRASKAAGEAGGEALEEGLSDVDGKELLAKLRVIRTKAQAAMAGMSVDFDVDPENIQTELRRLQAQLRATELEIALRPEVDDANLRGVLAGLRRQIIDGLEEIRDEEGNVIKPKLDRRGMIDLANEANELLLMAMADTEVTVEARTELDKASLITALAEAELIAEQTARREFLLRFGIDVDSAAAMAKLEAELLGFEATGPHLHLEAEVEVNRANLFFELREIHALAEAGLGDFEANVEVRIDRASKAKADALLERNFRETGRRAGSGFGGNLISGDNTKLFLLAGLAMGDALSAGLSGGLAAATSVVSSAITALGAAAGAAAPLLASLGAAMGSVVIGSQGMGPAFTAINEEFALAATQGREAALSTEAIDAALANLAPSAQATVLEFGRLRDEFADMRLAVQERLFAGLGDTLRELGVSTLPDIEDAFGTAADSVNRFGKQLGEVAKRTDFSAVAEDLAPALDDAFDAGTALADTLVPFLSAAAPAAERLAEMIERGAEGMRDWVSANPESIAGFLDDGLTSLESWVELLKSTGDLLGTIFDAGSESGDGFVVALNNIIERWDGFLESARGQDALSEFFDSGREAMAALQPVVDGLKEAFDILVTDETMGRFAELAAAIGDALPALAELISLIGELQLAAGFANALAALEPLFNLIALIPDEMMEVAGTAIVVAAGLAKLVAALKAVGLASQALSLTNPVIFGIGVAITGLAVILDNFESKSATAAAQTDNLTRALQNNVDAAINSGNAINTAAIALDELNRTVFEGADGGEKIQAAFAAINAGAGDATLGIDDTVRVLSGLREEGDASIPMLQQLAEGYGLPAEAARRLGEIVANTDDNLAAARSEASPLAHDLEDLAETFGLSEESVVRLFGALEELQDQGENTDLTAMQQAFLDVVSTGTEAEQQILATATRLQESGEIAAGVAPLYEAVVTALADTAGAHDDAAVSAATYGDVFSTMDQAIAEATAAQEARNAALKAERDAAFDAYQAELKLAGAIEDAAVAAAAGLGVPEELAQQFVDLGNAAQEASEKADALSSTFDILFGRPISAAQQFDDFQRMLRETTDALTILSEEGTTELPKVGSGLEAVFGQTEAAQNFRDAMRDGALSMFDISAAALEAGAQSEAVTAQFEAMRGQLVTLGMQFGLTEADAAGYVNTLLASPEVISTLIQTPGLFDALLNADQLTLVYDEMGNPVITEFEALGLDSTKILSEDMLATLQALGLINVAPTVDASGTEAALTAAQDVATETEALDSVTGTPVVTVDVGQVLGSISEVATALANIDATTVAPSITVNTGAAITAVNNLKRAIDSVQSKTVTITVQQIGDLLPGGALGGVVPRGGGIGGEAGMELFHTPGGSFGVTNQAMLFPAGTELTPLGGSRDAALRSLLELLKEGGAVGRPTTVINQYFTLTSADPAAVSVQTMNRAAAAALT